MSALADALGHKAVRTLAGIAGGRSLRIPRFTTDPTSVAARARLVALVGPDIAADLITAFAGSRVYVPSGGPGSANSRANPISRAAVIRLTKRGWSAPRIAARLGCSERTVHAKRAQARASRKD